MACEICGSLFMGSGNSGMILFIGSVNSVYGLYKTSGRWIQIIRGIQALSRS